MMVEGTSCYASLPSTVMPRSSFRASFGTDTFGSSTYIESTSIGGREPGLLRRAGRTLFGGP